MQKVFGTAGEMAQWLQDNVKEQSLHDKLMQEGTQCEQDYGYYAIYVFNLPTTNYFGLTKPEYNDPFTPLNSSYQ